MTGTTSTQTVQHVWINHDTDLLDVTLHSADTAHLMAGTSDAKQRAVALRAHGLRAPPDDQADLTRSGTTAGAAQDETVHTTANHPWLTADRGWVPAGELHRGEQIVREGDAAPATVTTLRVVAGTADYYNLTVSVLHTYAVGDGQYVVHNGNCNYGKLRQNNPSIGANDAPHHVIPCACKDHDLIKLAGFDVDGYPNGRGLARDMPSAALRNEPSHPLQWAQGYHRVYNSTVTGWLNDENNALTAAGRLTPGDANAAVLRVIDRTNQWINALGSLYPGAPLP